MNLTNKYPLCKYLLFRQTTLRQHVKVIFKNNASNTTMRVPYLGNITIISNRLPGQSVVELSDDIS